MTSQEFEDKFMRLAPHLYQVAFSMLQNPQDAEDVVQETFVKLWRDRQRLEAFENAEGYAMRMLRNACIDCLRLRQEETELVTYEERIANPEPPPRMDDGQKVNFILQHLPPQDATNHHHAPRERMLDRRDLRSDGRNPFERAPNPFPHTTENC